jgi:hypothetical protein
VLGGDVKVVELLGAARRRGDHLEQRPGHFRRAQRGPARSRQPGQALLGLLGDERRVGADRLEQRSGGAVRLLEQGQQQVQGFDLRAAVRPSAPERGGQRFLAPASQLVIH